MKKIALALASVCLLAPSALAYTVGTVDTARVFRDARSISQAQAEVRKEEEKYQNELAERQKKLEESRKTMKEEELEKLRSKYTTELGQMRDRAQKLNAQLSQKVKGMVEVAIRQISAQKKLDLVIDKQAVFFGGLDITPEVIKKLNGK
ncbi:MAG TPA: OmpH family outer membrane protein [Chroococcales cyanobacterium]|jgi:outer membrane protein